MEEIGEVGQSNAKPKPHTDPRMLRALFTRSPWDYLAFTWIYRGYIGDISWAMEEKMETTTLNPKP